MPGLRRVVAGAPALLGLLVLSGHGLRAAPAAGAGADTTSAAAGTAVSPDLQRACEAVANLSLPETRLTLAQPIDPQPAYVIPETAHDKPGRFGGGPVRVGRPFCRVAGMVTPAIRFEVWLPLTGWNGRFEGLGLGAFSGALPYRQMAAALANGYAVGGTDTGHESGGFDAGWAMTARHTLNRIAVEDWTYRGIHEMTAKSQAVAQAVFGTRPRYSYFVGCSSGGGQALAEASVIRTITTASWPAPRRTTGRI